MLKQSDEPNRPSFADVARAIALGGSDDNRVRDQVNALLEMLGQPRPNREPPQWLIDGLEQFSELIAPRPPTPERPSPEAVRFRKVLGDPTKAVERMHKAATVLLEGLSLFDHLPAGIQCPDDVRMVREALPRVMNWMEPQRRIGRKPETKRAICAAIVIEAWTLVHGEAPGPRSVPVQQACVDYWRACGGAQIGATDDPENWRRPLEQASDTDHRWIANALLYLSLDARVVQNPP